MTRTSQQRRFDGDLVRRADADAAARAGNPTCGGLPYDYLPTEHNMVQWEQAISRAEYPDERDLVKWDAFFEWSGHAASTFLTEGMRRMLDASSQPSGPQGLVFDNLPHPHCGNPPADGRRPAGKSAVSEAVMPGVVRSAGYEVFGYVQEKDGDLVH